MYPLLDCDAVNPWTTFINEKATAGTRAQAVQDLQDLLTDACVAEGRHLYIHHGIQDCIGPCRGANKGKSCNTIAKQISGSATVVVNLPPNAPKMSPKCVSIQNDIDFWTDKSDNVRDVSALVEITQELDRLKRLFVIFGCQAAAAALALATFTASAKGEAECSCSCGDSPPA